ncbi:MAG: diguanylate cyclase [Spirochaetota bacterium]
MENLLRSRMFRQQFIIHSLYFIIILGILFYQVGMQTIKELEVQQEHLANVYRDQLEASLTGWYGGQRSTLKAFSMMLESMSGKELASPTATALISNILAAYPEVSDLVIIDSQGTIVNARIKTANTGAYNLADRPYFKTALEHGEGGSGFFANKINGKLTIALSRRIQNREGDTYVLALYITFDSFLKNFSIFTENGLGSTYLLDPDGRTLFASDPENGLVLTAEHCQLVKQQRKGHIDLKSQLYGKIHSAYFWMDSLQVAVLVVVAPELLLAPLQKVEVFMVLLGIIAMLVSLLLSYWMTAQVYRPISSLVKAVNEMAASNYNHNISVQAEGEIGLLIESFNKMQRIVAERETSLKDTAQRDSLTGLFNHGTLLELLDSAVQTRSSVSLVMLDIDHFKTVNDTYGHQAGDMVLQRLSQILVSSLRERDIIARYGGEEFAIIPYNTGYEPMLCERLRRNVEMADFIFNEQPIPITISIGWTTLTIPERPDSPRICSAIIQAADSALYQAKKGGRNRVEKQLFEGAELSSGTKSSIA